MLSFEREHGSPDVLLGVGAAASAACADAYGRPFRCVLGASRDAIRSRSGEPHTRATTCP